MEKQKVMVVGDTHACFEKLNRLIFENKPDIVIVCGDFGYWIPMSQFAPIRPQGSKIYFCDGNHENHMFLNALLKAQDYERTPIEIQDNVFYMPRGSTLDIDGQTLLFMGGAESIDKAYRIKGYDWFEEESISWIDLDKVPRGLKPDIIITHTAPDFIIRQIGGEGDKHSEKVLRTLYARHKPKHWYFGHMHRVCEKKTGGVEFHGLNEISKAGCWQWMKTNGGSSGGQG
jgi:Icc-related predicted phosphoesterase